MTTHTSKATNGAHNHSALIDDLIARIGTVLLGKTDKIKNLVSAFRRPVTF